MLLSSRQARLGRIQLKREIKINRRSQRSDFTLLAARSIRVKFHNWRDDIRVFTRRTRAACNDGQIDQRIQLFRHARAKRRIHVALLGHLRINRIDPCLSLKEQGSDVAAFHRAIFVGFVKHFELIGQVRFDRRLFGRAIIRLNASRACIRVNVGQQWIKITVRNRFHQCFLRFHQRQRTLICIGQWRLLTSTHHIDIVHQGRVIEVPHDIMQFAKVFFISSRQFGTFCWIAETVVHRFDINANRTSIPHRATGKLFMDHTKLYFHTSGKIVANLTFHFRYESRHCRQCVRFVGVVDDRVILLIKSCISKRAIKVRRVNRCEPRCDLCFGHGLCGPSRNARGNLLLETNQRCQIRIARTRVVHTALGGWATHQVPVFQRQIVFPTYFIIELRTHNCARAAIQTHLGQIRAHAGVGQGCIVFKVVVINRTGNSRKNRFACDCTGRNRTRIRYAHEICFDLSWLHQM